MSCNNSVFFHFSKTRAASADPKSANEQQFKLEWTIRVANSSSIKMLLVKMNVVLTPAWLKSEMYTAPVQSSAHKTLTQVSCCEGESFYISCRYLRVDICTYVDISTQQTNSGVVVGVGVTVSAFPHFLWDTWAGVRVLGGIHYNTALWEFRQIESHVLIIFMFIYPCFLIFCKVPQLIWLTFMDKMLTNYKIQTYHRPRSPALSVHCIKRRIMS